MFLRATMRRVDIDPDSGTVRVDWHGYSSDQVETWADRIVEAAYEHGFARVEFVHGAADIATRGTPGYGGDSVSGRGRIKDILRDRLYGRRWRRWALDVREGKHEVVEGRMTIALCENPSPARRARWPILPPAAH